MIKVLDKTFAILEEIVCEAPRPLGPQELAKRLGLNRTTCSRIIRILLDSGYIVQVSRQAGYTAGPKILTLSNRANFASELMSAAVPIIDRTAERLKASVLLSQVWNDERYILHISSRSPKKNIRPHHLCYRDIYNTASGAVEMAYREPEEALRIYDTMPDEARTWLLPEFREKKQIIRHLKGIRRRGYYHCSRKNEGIFAFPIFSEGRYVAALGCLIGIEDYTDRKIPFYIRTGKQAADEITSALTTTDHIG